LLERVDFNGANRRESSKLSGYGVVAEKFRVFNDLPGINRGKLTFQLRIWAS
jgi:hypothetical protein